MNEWRFVLLTSFGEEFHSDSGYESKEEAEIHAGRYIKNHDLDKDSIRIRTEQCLNGPDFDDEAVDKTLRAISSMTDSSPLQNILIYNIVRYVAAQGLSFDDSIAMIAMFFERTGITEQMIREKIPVS